MLRHLPLAIVQAGAYISILDISLASFFRAFASESMRDETVLNTRLNGSDAVYTTWEISFQSIKVKSPQAAELLLLCSFLSSENIPEEMLSTGLQLKRQGGEQFLSIHWSITGYTNLIPYQSQVSRVSYLFYTNTL